MARPREFDREEALERATSVFWPRATPLRQPTICSPQWGSGGKAFTTRFRINERSIWRRWRDISGRPSRDIYNVSMALRLRSPESRRCYSDSSATMTIFVRLAAWGSCHLRIRLDRSRHCGASRQSLSRAPPPIDGTLKEGQAAGEIDRSLDCATAASFIQLMMQSIQLAARGGIDARRCERKHDLSSNA